MYDMDEFTFEQKEKLARKIQKLKNGKYYCDVHNIIKNHNPNINITTNSSGHYMYFHNLSAITYNELDKYINNVSKKKEKMLNEATIDSYNIINTENEQFSGNPRLRYSNQEKNLIKRKNYVELLGNNCNIDQIFVKKNKK